MTSARIATGVLVAAVGGVIAYWASDVAGAVVIAIGVAVLAVPPRWLPRSSRRVP